MNKYKTKNSRGENASTTAATTTKYVTVTISINTEDNLIKELLDKARTQGEEAKDRLLRFVSDALNWEKCRNYDILHPELARQDRDDERKWRAEQTAKRKKRNAALTLAA